MIHVPHTAPVLAMDVHRTHLRAVLGAGSTTPVLDEISADEEMVRRLVRRFDDPRRVWACYEAGLTGYELARLLRSLGVAP